MQPTWVFVHRALTVNHTEPDMELCKSVGSRQSAAQCTIHNTQLSNNSNNSTTTTTTTTTTTQQQRADFSTRALIWAQIRILAQIESNSSQNSSSEAANSKLDQTVGRQLNQRERLFSCVASRVNMIWLMFCVLLAMFELISLVGT